MQRRANSRVERIAGQLASRRSPRAGAQKLVCSACKAVVVDGDEPASQMICPVCLPGERARMDAHLAARAEPVAATSASASPSCPAPTSEPLAGVSAAVTDKIGELVLAGHFLFAIKLYRETTGQGLRESKEYIDTLRAKLHAAGEAV